MAVIQSLPLIEVVITNQNREAYTEYDDDDEESKADGVDPKTKCVNKYIEAITGEEFYINIQTQEPYNPYCGSLGFDTTVDGQSIDSAVLSFYSNGIKTSSDHDIIVQGAEMADTVRPMKFAMIETSSTEKALSQIEVEATKISNMGEILVEVFRLPELGVLCDSQLREPDLAVPAEVHEKAMKGQAKSHGVSLGDSRPLGMTNIVYILSNLDTYPIARYSFKYRSKEALKQLLILERTPEPVVEAPAVSIDDLNAEQRRKVELYMQSLLGNGSKIKRERPESSATASSSKRPKGLGEKVVIDLTDD